MLTLMNPWPQVIARRPSVLELRHSGTNLCSPCVPYSKPIAPMGFSIVDIPTLLNFWQVSYGLAPGTLARPELQL